MLLQAPAWPHGSKVVTKKNPLPVPAAVLEQTTTYPKASTTQEITMHNVLFLTAHALTGKAGELNRLDEQVGDGDTGSTLALGAQQIMADLTAGYYPLTDPSGLCKALARSCRSMGGSSGALYEILFTAAAGMLLWEKGKRACGKRACGKRACGKRACGKNALHVQMPPCSSVSLFSEHYSLSLCHVPIS